MRPLTFRLFLFFKVPLAYWAGLRLLEAGEDAVCIGIRHNCINKNPFRSIYFAAQSMAAEIATGLLCRHHIQNAGRRVSFLVVNQEAVFLKKATGRIRFRCSEGQQVREALTQAFETGQGVTVTLSASGVDQAGDTVSRMKFTWSFKAA